MNDTAKPQTEVEKLREDNALKADLISISAHQLRTSLSAIKWVMKMILDKDVGPLTGEQEGLLKKASDSNERMIVLVNDLLNLNHAQDIVLGYTFEQVQFEDILESVLFEFMSETKKRGIEILFIKPETDLSLINADKAKLRVVLQNLIENAIKYSKDGSKIFISLTEDTDGLKFSIKDNGIGIPEDVKAHIFEKFYRAPNAERWQTVGSGLGLFTVKKIVERHGGKIWFSSEGGSASGGESNGTTFYITLPKNSTFTSEAKA